MEAQQDMTIQVDSDTIVRNTSKAPLVRIWIAGIVSILIIGGVLVVGGAFAEDVQPWGPLGPEVPIVEGSIAAEPEDTHILLRLLDDCEEGFSAASISIRESPTQITIGATLPSPCARLPTGRDASFDLEAPIGNRQIVYELTGELLAEIPESLWPVVERS